MWCHTIGVAANPPGEQSPESLGHRKLSGKRSSDVMGPKTMIEDCGILSVRSSGLCSCSTLPEHNPFSVMAKPGVVPSPHLLYFLPIFLLCCPVLLQGAQGVETDSGPCTLRNCLPASNANLLRCVSASADFPTHSRCRAAVPTFRCQPAGLQLRDGPKRAWGFGFGIQR